MNAGEKLFDRYLKGMELAVPSTILTGENIKWPALITSRREVFTKMTGKKIRDDDEEYQEFKKAWANRFDVQDSTDNINVAGWYLVKLGLLNPTNAPRSIFCSNYYSDIRERIKQLEDEHWMLHTRGKASQRERAAGHDNIEILAHLVVDDGQRGKEVTATEVSWPRVQGDLLCLSYGLRSSKLYNAWTLQSIVDDEIVAGRSHILKNPSFCIQLGGLCGSISFQRAALLAQCQPNCRDMNESNIVIYLTWIFAAGTANVLVMADDALSQRGGSSSSKARQAMRRCLPHLLFISTD